MVAAGGMPVYSSSVVLVAQRSRQFMFGPDKGIDERWAAPSFPAKLGAFNETTISHVEAACAEDLLKIRAVGGLMAV